MRSRQLRPIWGVVRLYHAKLSFIIAICALAACSGNDSSADDGGGGGGSASGTITSAGGTVSTADNKVSVEVPAGAVDHDITITIAASTSAPSDPLLVGQTTFTFGPAGETFTKPVTMTIAYDAAEVPSAAVEDELILHKVTAGAWAPVAVSAVDTTAHKARALVTSFSTYGVKADERECNRYPACGGAGNQCTCNEKCNGMTYALICPGSGMCYCSYNGEASWGFFGKNTTADCTDMETVRAAWNTHCFFPLWRKAKADAGPAPDTTSPCSQMTPACGGVSSTCSCTMTCEGDTYKVDCTGAAACDCLKNGAKTGTVKASCSSSLQGAWGGCGFPGWS